MFQTTFCPYCQKVTNMYLSSKKIIKMEENDVETFVIIENYDCQECGRFLFSCQKPAEEIKN